MQLEDTLNADDRRSRAITVGEEEARVSWDSLTSLDALATRAREALLTRTIEVQMSVSTGGTSYSSDFNVQTSGGTPAGTSTAPPSSGGSDGGSTSPPIQISPNSPDYDEILKNPPPQPTPQQPVMDSSLNEPAPPLRSPDDEQENPHTLEPDYSKEPLPESEYEETPGE
jgi:hypothetical protein